MMASYFVVERLDNGSYLSIHKGTPQDANEEAVSLKFWDKHSAQALADTLAGLAKVSEVLCLPYMNRYDHY